MSGQSCSMHGHCLCTMQRLGCLAPEDVAQDSERAECSCHTQSQHGVLGRQQVIVQPCNAQHCLQNDTPNQVQDRHCEHCLRNQFLHNITHPVRSWAAHRLTRQHAMLHEHIYLIRMAGLSTLLSHNCEFPAPEVSGSADTAVSQGLVILHHAGIRGHLV